MKAYALILIHLVLFLITALSLSSAINPCLYNREDVLPCLDYLNAGVLSPGVNEYTVHATRFQRNALGLPICVKRKEGELLTDIEDLGTPHVKFLFSPGADQSPPMNYPNQIVQEFNVVCESGRTAFIAFEEDKFNLEPKNCHDGSEYKCQDYVHIDAGVEGSGEYCGNVLPGLFTVDSGTFTLKLRTSFYTSYPGFLASVVCFNDEPDNTTTTASESTTTTPESTTTTPESTTTTPDSNTTTPENTTTTPENTTTTPESTTTINENTTTTPESTTTTPESTTTTPESIATTSNEEITTTTSAAAAAAFLSVNAKSTSVELANLRLDSRPTTNKPLRSITLTTEEKTILRIMFKSLFRVALMQARRKNPSWPPISYSQNDAKDILDLSELVKQTQTPTTTRLGRSSSSISPKISGIEEAVVKPHIRRNQPHRRATPVVEAELDYSATFQAVKFESATNPIIRTVASSYIIIAQRLVPQQLKTAREAFEKAISVQPVPVLSKE